MKEYFHLKTKKGDIIIRDSTRDDLRSLTKIYKKSFKKHNIFQKSAFRVEDYLLDNHKKHCKGGGFIVAKNNRDIVGGMLLKCKEVDIKGKHSRWRFNHIAVETKFRRIGVATKLLEAGIQKINNMIKEKKFKSAKIELLVTQKEANTIKLYKKAGFKIEGELGCHYRFNESSYILGKELKIPKL
ncbi:GNAT family N-acetyltransferase [Candidatus Woesearchaeota archaeon]|nr:GNAT family N-acetyltransferase [Candidatus Woesearchaeota archaeon]